MGKAKVLVIEDEKDILELIRYNLAREGYQVTTADSGEKGLKAAKSKPPDVIVLDLMLPGMDGLEVCRLLKSDPRTRRVPVIMLTAKSEETDIVTGLELGADDYMTKPFSPKVLIARLRKTLRREKSAGDGGILRPRDLVIDPGRHAVTVAGKPVELTFTEFRILHLLAGRPGWVFNRYQIVEAVRGEDYAVTDRSVDVQIVGLRKKLGRSGKEIETVRGVGYRFKE